MTHTFKHGKRILWFRIIRSLKVRLRQASVKTYGNEGGAGVISEGRLRFASAQLSPALLCSGARSRGFGVQYAIPPHNARPYCAHDHRAHSNSKLAGLNSKRLGSGRSVTHTMFCSSGCASINTPVLRPPLRCMSVCVCACCCDSNKARGA